MMAMADADAALPLVTSAGELVALGPPRRDLVPVFLRWANDFGTQRTLGDLPAPVTFEQEVGGYEYDVRRMRTAGEVRFVVYQRADRRPIGVCRLFDLDERNRAAAFAILIGEPAYRGRGYGTEATRLTLDYAFSVLGLHSVALTVYEYNLAGRRAYSNAGFCECGRRRQAQWLGGRWWDVICMECLASAFARSAR
jgi:diamine N-acetyltransferase